MYQKKKNYVMAGVPKYGIGDMPADMKKQIIEGQIEVQDEAQKKALTYAAVGAGIGWFVSKGFMGLALGGLIGYFLPNLLKEVEVVHDADSGAEPAPEKPSGQNPDFEKELEESF